MTIKTVTLPAGERVSALGQGTWYMGDIRSQRAQESDVERRGTDVGRREQGIADREAHARQLQQELTEARQKELRELERIGGISQAQARDELVARSADEIRHELARRARVLDEEAQSDARRKARNLVADALQRVAASHAAETTVSLVELASDDMKGRIIGREGRNIRALEHVTGVDVIIDDTPNAVVLSSFDGIRRPRKGDGCFRDYRAVPMVR